MTRSSDDASAAVEPPQAKKAKMDDDLNKEEEKDGSPSWLPAGCTHVVVPVRQDHDNDKQAKFVFPADLIYDTLASLLGLLVNPWTTSGGNAAKASVNYQPGARHIFVDNPILYDLQVTVEMCESYALYCRTGNCQASFHTPTSSPLLDFLIRAAAPEELLQKIMLNISKENIRMAITAYIQSLGAPNYNEHMDKVQFFAEWYQQYDPNDPPHDANVIYISGTEYTGFPKYVRKYDSPQAINALRKRIRHEIRRLVENLTTLQPMSGDSVQSIRLFALEMMYEETLPYYNVHILADDDEY